MFTKSTRLYVRRPSPTTAEFTVTTCPPLTLGLRLFFFLVSLGRVALATVAFFLIYSKWTLCPFAMRSPPAHDPNGPLVTSSLARPAVTLPDFFVHALSLAHASPTGRLLTQLAAISPTWALLPACGIALYLAVRRVYTTETLLVLRGLGIQTSSSGVTFLTGGAGSARFIPTEKIQDVLINEAFRGFEVRYYLVVVVEGEEDIVVVFPRLLPGRKTVETVWRGVRSCLYEPDAAVRGLSGKNMN